MARKGVHRDAYEINTLSWKPIWAIISPTSMTWLNMYDFMSADY